MKSVHNKRDATRCIERQLLPQFDNKFNNVIGCFIFYDFLQKKATNKCPTRQQQTIIFTTELFAHYLVMLRLLNAHSDFICTLQKKFYNRYKVCLLGFRNTLITDVLLFCAIYKSKPIYIRNVCKLQVYSSSHQCDELTQRLTPTEFNERRLCRLLTQNSVELLTNYRLMMLRDIASVRTIVTTDYQAMYAYRCGLYQQCYDLCYVNVNRLLHKKVNRHTWAISALSDRGSSVGMLLIAGMSVIGLAALCGVVDPPSDYRELLTQLTLSIYLLVQCKLQLKHATLTFTEVLRKVKLVHDRHDMTMVISRSVLTFVYRRSVLLLHRMSQI